jgi:hypothetical protein
VRNRFRARRYEAAAVPLDIPKMLDEGRQFGRCGEPLVKEDLITRLRRMQHTSRRSYARCKMRGLASCFFNTAAVRCSKVTDEAYL